MHETRSRYHLLRALVLHQEQSKYILTSSNELGKQRNARDAWYRPKRYGNCVPNSTSVSDTCHIDGFELKIAKATAIRDPSGRNDSKLYEHKWSRRDKTGRQNWNPESWSLECHPRTALAWHVLPHKSQRASMSLCKTKKAVTYNRCYNINRSPESASQIGCPYTQQKTYLTSSPNAYELFMSTWP